eukprot:CAMPEP_0202891622 /NCGR_PEP_ID=MMETSP1392-20130828/1634_1 /ASSEMBLY_ACC=CAM_ASM_000868 /TAXON_ID=225041 /ORGANISM="Chlamydomonas chlamydogama, Strain SAG 11-48b" /LENGTH=885 /DNA_ID=CAMNT_0049575427 /DNA_START=214 /DNA_END=2871 /DNA_ORIENTATION=+
MSQGNVAVPQPEPLSVLIDPIKLGLPPTSTAQPLLGAEGSGGLGSSTEQNGGNKGPALLGSSTSRGGLGSSESSDIAGDSWRSTKANGGKEEEAEQEAVLQASVGTTQQTHNTASAGKRGRPNLKEEEAAHKSSPRKQRRQNMQETEATASQLSNKLQDMGELQSSMLRLQEQNAKLEAALRDKEAEIGVIRQAAGKGAGDNPLGGPTSSHNPTISEQELKQAYCNSVQSLKDYITGSNLLSYDITGKNLPDKMTADLKTLIHQISKVCLQVIKPETPFVLDLISKDYSQATITDWELDKSHWINVIAQLQLTDQQVMTILKSRDQHVNKMISLYSERAVLMRQAADMAIRSATTGTGMTAGSMVSADDNSNMGVLMRHGYLYCARNMVALHRVLEFVKDNLQREQKTVMELFLKIVYQILSPVQAALFVVESFPYHCDVLALANVLFIVFGKDSNMAGSMGLAGGMGLGNNGLGMASGSGSMGVGSLNAGGMVSGNLGGSTALGGGGLGPSGLGTGNLGVGLGPGSLGAGGLGGTVLTTTGAGHGGLGGSGLGLSGLGAGGDADVMASWLQMQGGQLDPFDAQGGTSASALQATSVPVGDMNGPTSEGLSRLKKFLDSAGMLGASSGFGGSLGGGNMANMNGSSGLPSGSGRLSTGLNAVMGGSGAVGMSGRNMGMPGMIPVEVATAGMPSSGLIGNDIGLGPLPVMGKSANGVGGWTSSLLPTDVVGGMRPQGGSASTTTGLAGGSGLPNMSSNNNTQMGMLPHGLGALQGSKGGSGLTVQMGGGGLMGGGMQLGSGLGVTIGGGTPGGGATPATANSPGLGDFGLGSSGLSGLCMNSSMARIAMQRGGNVGSLDLSGSQPGASMPNVIGASGGSRLQEMPRG